MVLARKNPWKKQRPLNTIPAEKMNSLHLWFFYTARKLDTVDFRRSLFSSVTCEDEVSSPLFTSSIAVWNSLNLWKSFRLSIGIRSAQFSSLQSILRNQKTIISLTIICHSISVFLSNVWKIEPRQRRKSWKKTDVLSNQFDKFSFLTN